MTWHKVKLRVQRTTVEYTDIEYGLDVDAYDEWTGGNDNIRPELVVEFIKADRDFPGEAIDEYLTSATWAEDDIEIDVLTL